MMLIKSILVSSLFVYCLIEAKELRTKVVVLGAGAAGISAAKTLTNSNLHDFIILDAQSFIGGNKNKFDKGNICLLVK